MTQLHLSWTHTQRTPYPPTERPTHACLLLLHSQEQGNVVRVVVHRRMENTHMVPGRDGTSFSLKEKWWNYRKFQSSGQNWKFYSKGGYTGPIRQALHGLAHLQILASNLHSSVNWGRSWVEARKLERRAREKGRSFIRWRMVRVIRHPEPETGEAWRTQERKGERLVMGCERTNQSKTHGNATGNPLLCALIKNIELCNI